MARDFQISGESLVLVKGNTATSIATLTQLGLAVEAISVSLAFTHDDCIVDAYGASVPEIQFMGASAEISMTLVHYDALALAVCVAASMGGAVTEGLLPRAGTRMGGGALRFAPLNNFIGLNITSPVEARPYRFPFAYLAAPPFTIPLGTRRSMVQLRWRAVPYTIDPWNGGLGSFGATLYDHILDN